MRCDGLVVATPQGSTGYNLANGGPVMAWGVEGYVVSFVAPHSLTARALVVAPGDLLTINNASREEPVEVHVDGRPTCELAAGRGRARRVRARVRHARPAAGRELLPPPARAVRTTRALTCESLQISSRNCAPAGPSGAAGTPSRRAARAARREPAADRAGRAAARARAERAHGRDRRGQDRARPRARPAARRQARPGIVRPGAAEAYVEGVFALPAALRDTLGDRLPEDAEELVLARRVSAEGRTRAYVGGRSATAADLAKLGGALLSFYGQHEHRRLTLASAQLEILDGFCGAEQASAARRSRPPMRASGRCARRWRSCASAPARATASSTCWSGSSRRSSAPAPTEAEEESLRRRARAAAPRRGAAAAAGGGAAALAPSEDGDVAALAGAAAARSRPSAASTQRSTRWPTARPRCRRGRRPRGRAAPLRRGDRGAARAGSTRSRSASRCSTG